MEGNTEQVKKTPGDLKREALAQTLGGKGWKFFENYFVIDPKVVITYLEKGAGRILAKFEDDRLTVRQIANWRLEQKAFEDDGREIPFSQQRSAYIKPKAQVK